MDSAEPQTDPASDTDASPTPSDASDGTSSDDSTATPSDDAATGRVTVTERAAKSAPDADAAGRYDVERLVAGFGKNEVLHGISIEIPPRSVTALIGPSGCGKSTFIRCLNRMHELVPIAYSTGSIQLDGYDIYDRAVDPVLLRRRVGMVFQRPNPFPSMSIRDNVLSGLKLTGRYKRSEADDIAERALRGAALWDEVKDRLGDRATGLSGGQQQRLCIARSIAVEPEVLLMDEPCSALDPVATGRIEDLIHELRERYTIIIVTHNMQQAARVSDQTAFLLSGDLIEFDETTKLFTSPSDQRTEDYITGRFG